MRPLSSALKAEVDPNKLAYSIKEFCAAAGVGRTTVYQAIKTGSLIARKSGKRTLIGVSDALRWLDELPIAKIRKVQK